MAKGLEAAFRKRQNIGLAQAKAEVLALFDRAISEDLADPPAVRSLFSSVTERLSDLGLALGGSEAWADRLWIEDRKGALLFSEAELDTAEQVRCFGCALEVLRPRRRQIDPS